MQPHLCEYEQGQNEVNPSLQRLDQNGLVEELKQNQRKLQQETQEPETSQLRDLS
jgi:competence protein ComGC